jgi:hypothetical protein
MRPTVEMPDQGTIPFLTGLGLRSSPVYYVCWVILMATLLGASRYMTSQQSIHGPLREPPGQADCCNGHGGVCGCAGGQLSCCDNTVSAGPNCICLHSDLWTQAPSTTTSCVRPPAE